VDLVDRHLVNGRFRLGETPEERLRAFAACDGERGPVNQRKDLGKASVRMVTAGLLRIVTVRVGMRVVVIVRVTMSGGRAVVMRMPVVVNRARPVGMAAGMAGVVD
jgi:hypothetical protein